MKYRVQLYGDPDRESPVTYAARLWDLASAITATDPRADRWRFERGDTCPVVHDRDTCAAAVEVASYAWEIGEDQRVSYEPSLFVGEPDAPTVIVTYTCGIGTVPLEGIFCPTRLEILLDEGMLQNNGAQLLQTLMLKAIEIMKPRFGHAGTESAPPPLMPLTRRPSPPVGWLTYLSHALGEAPHQFSTPTVAYPAPDGILIVAHPSLFLPFKKEHTAAVRAVGETLVAAKIVGSAA